LKEKILETAMRCFAEHGIRAVKMDDLASQLGISKRTLYEIYKDKETLLFQGIKTYDKRKHDALERYASEGHNVIDIVLEAYRMKVMEVRAFNPTFYEDILIYPQLERYIKENHERSLAGFNAFMQRGVREGYFRPDVNYDMITHLFETIGQYILNNKLFSQYSLKELFANFFLVPLRGVCTPAGLRLLDESDLDFCK